MDKNILRQHMQFQGSQSCVYLQESSIISLRTSSSTATPMLSLVITLFNIASEPSELAMASWLNSTVCFCTALNLETDGGKQEMGELNDFGEL